MKKKPVKTKAKVNPIEQLRKENEELRQELVRTLQERQIFSDSVDAATKRNGALLESIEKLREDNSKASNMLSVKWVQQALREQEATNNDLRSQLIYGEETVARLQASLIRALKLLQLDLIDAPTK